MHNDFRAGLEYDTLWRLLQYDRPDVTILMDCAATLVRLAIFEVHRSTTDEARQKQTFVGHIDYLLGEDSPYASPCIQLGSELYCT